ncbi:MAG: MtrB/PioB family decaheme-associated outer membrane protein [bacterium]|mgnify:CR=1 FL=1
MKLWTYIFCTCVLVLLPAVRGMAADDVSGKVSAGIEYFGGDEDNAKFNEYRYQTNSNYGASVKMNLYSAPEGANLYRKFLLNARSQEDLGLSLQEGSFGVYRFNLKFNRMGHNFAYDAPTLYSGNGSGVLSLPDAMQTDLQNNTLPQNNSSTTNDLATRLSPYVNAANEIDLSLKRDTFAAGLEWMGFDPFTFGFDFSQERRDGSRPFGGTFGFSNAVEIPEPIDYTTTKYGLKGEYATKPYYANLSYGHSTFNNHNLSVLYDNPFRIDDDTDIPVGDPRNVSATSSIAAYSSSYLTGSSTGRTSLPPDNTFDSINTTLSTLLPVYDTRATANIAYGYAKQDDDLMPVTTNTAIAGYPLALPANSVNAQVDTRLYDLILTSRPAEKLDVKVRYKYDQRRNKTDELTIANYVRSDATIEGSSTPNYVSYIKRIAELELAYELMDRTTLTVGYEKETNSFSNGSADSEDEDIYKISLDSRVLDWATGRLSLEYFKKDSDYPDYTSGELPWMRKFYAASKDGLKASAAATLMPNDKLNLNLELSYGKDDYKDSEFGLQDDRNYTGTVDADYEVNKRLTLNAFYTYENQKSMQRSRQWTPSQAGDPFSATYSDVSDPSNWTAEITDIVNTIGLGAEVGIIEGLLDLDLNGTYSKSNGKVDFASAVGIAPASPYSNSNMDNNAFKPMDFGNMDDTRLATVCARLNYKLSKAWTTTLGYKYERWTIDDYLYDGYSPIKTNTSDVYNGLLSMDTYYKPYKVNTVYVTATYSF